MFFAHPLFELPNKVWKVPKRYKGLGSGREEEDGLRSERNKSQDPGCFPKVRVNS